MDLDDRLQSARAAGATWDQINASLEARKQAARNAGATEAQINTGLGYTDPGPMMSRMRANAQANMAAHPPELAADDAYGSFINGLQSSSGGLIARSRLPDATMSPNPNFASRIANMAGVGLGDIPAMIQGGFMGGRAGALVPGAGETGTSEAIGAGAGAFALPQAIKSEYLQALNKGEVANADDFIERQMGVLWDTTKAGVIGGLTGGAGKLAGSAAVSQGAGPVTAFMTKSAAELATMTTAGAAMQGRLPTREDFIDGAVMIAAFHVAGATVKSASQMREALQRNWQATDENPLDAARRASVDPVFRAQLFGVRKPLPDEVPAGSSTTAAPPPEHFTVDQRHTADLMPGASHAAPGADQFVVPRIAGSFDPAVNWILKEEGGLTTDTGGLTNRGISQKANPDLSSDYIRNLTEAQAKQLYYERYWKPAGIENLPDNMKLAAFDSAVNQGVGQTRIWLREANGDLQEFMRLRSQKYAELARDPHYAKYANSWAARMRHLGATEGMAGVVERGPAHESEPLNEEDMSHFRSVAEEEDAARPPTLMERFWKDDSGSLDPRLDPTVTPDPLDRARAVVDRADPWDIVGSRIGDTAKAPGLWERMQEAWHNTYLELFQPGHPIRQLADAVRVGDELPPQSNPEYLYRMSELSATRSKYMVERDMIDPQGNVTGPGLRAILDQHKGADFGRFLTYAVAKWAGEKAVQAKETGVAVDAARAVVMQGEAKYGPAFQQLVDWQNGTFNYMRGLVANKVVDAAIEQNKARIPGYRQFDEAPKPVLGAGAGKTAWSPVKEFFGSERKLEPILQSLLQEAFLRVELADRNRANLAALEAAEPIGLAARQGPPRNYDLLTALSDVKDAGVSDENIAAIMDNLSSQGLARDEVPVFEDGKMTRVKFQDPDLTRLLRGYDTASLATWQRIVNSLTKIQRGLIVLNPLFPVRLAGYDVPWQFITKPGFRNTLADFTVGLGHVIGNTPEYNAWLRSGGAERVFDGLSKSDYIKKVMKGQDDPSFTDGVWNTIKSPYEALRAWGQVIGQGERAGRFIRGRQQGEDDTTAAVASSEAAFHRAGFGGPHTKTINSVIPFFAAYLNSLEQTVRGQFGIGRTITGEKYNALQFTAKAAAIITLPVLAQWYHDRDKEWYKAAPDWQKDNGLFIHIGPDDGTGHTFFWKYPPLISLLYGGIPRRLAEAFVDDNPHAFDNMGASFGDALMPPGGAVLYNVFLPFIEHVANHSFFKDMPLVNDDTKRGVMPAEQYNQYSSGLARQIAQFTSDVPLVKGMKLSPPVIDNYLTNWGGTLGTAAIRATDQLTHAGPWKPGAPASQIEDWPLISSWMTRYPTASAEPIKTFYGRMDDFNAVHGSLVRAMENHDLARFTEIAAKYPTAAAVHAFNMRGKPLPADTVPYLQALRGAMAQADIPSARLIMQSDQAMKQAREYANRVYQAENLSPQDKRQILDATYAQMQVMSERANDVMDRAGFDGYHAGANTQPNPAKIGFTPPQPGL